MWVVFTVGSFFLLALLLPAGWALGNVWRRTAGERAVTCPANGSPALVALDQWHAVRMHARGDVELRVLNCTRWPEHQDCAQECLAQFGMAR